MQKIDIVHIIEEDECMMKVLRAVYTLQLPDWWIGAGFIRNKIWDMLQGEGCVPPGDIDVVYFDPANLLEDQEKIYEHQLENIYPTGKWSVKNMARMHVVNGDDPYVSSLDAIAHWPETATAVAVTLDESEKVLFQTPHGADDLLQMIIRPTPVFKKKLEEFRRRTEKKNWKEKWSKVQIKG
ncbi:MAG: hypothetical protein UU48_C0033G0008 [Candidatus Uhrbacteria bacterium GW2011_GWF2_41_16]|uniref:Nucleotidyltransferase family protein n=2 Tax=Candidatus Uhriibacteriota TaxID=1752732 RepID=A0A0G0V9E3_9BACT|nr:MAG: hypothetical protein UU31_C0003G0009 [Candidatus Uhrbacteria bacterium GW2011_GWA2_41_10]KKR87282.1 MAG: hypothetical protein UU35_C0004G0055 [Candidatus Uhrbacteria bacterium GW2011_GWC2_41_11]KKR96311.1 MAG: hypothetical protein UU48_C0033G0008 [Candidatus Uhrbacteria bacterium GW2011_GWF2_41_16]HBO99998.1 hypothetical protein [Candidatus Uhrbacteria bacterium]